MEARKNFRISLERIAMCVFLHFAITQQKTPHFGVSFEATSALTIAVPCGLTSNQASFVP